MATNAAVRFGRKSGAPGSHIALTKACRNDFHVIPLVSLTMSHRIREHIIMEGNKDLYFMETPQF